MTDLTRLGYAGKILRVDLTTGKTWSEALDEETVKKATQAVADQLKKK